MNDDLRLFYAWVKAARERVFTWAESLPTGVYTLERPDVPHGSVRNLHAHVADCYLGWTGWIGLNLSSLAEALDAQKIEDVAAMRAVFGQVDAIVDQALTHFTDPDAPLEVVVPPRGPLRVTGRWLILHPLTHEFHHKGQMLVLGRLLGHPYPSSGPGADLALPFET